MGFAKRAVSILVVSGITVILVSPAPAGLGPGDALLLTFAAAAVALGTVVFLLLRIKGHEEFCRLNLPPGPPAAWTLSKAA